MASKRTQALLYARRAAMAGIALLLLVAGVRSSWGTAQHVMLSKGREHGTMTVAVCGVETCAGPYTPDGPTTDHARVTIEKSIAVRRGAELPVVLKPGTAEAVRAGAPGVLHAWVPLGGALLLAALVVAGGLRLTRLAWGAALAGGVLLGATFLAL
ncbi:hypothetical protein [Streptomyces sp. NPDC054887]